MPAPPSGLFTGHQGPIRVFPYGRSSYQAPQWWPWSMLRSRRPAPSSPATAQTAVNLRTRMAC